MLLQRIRQRMLPLFILAGMLSIFPPLVATNLEVESDVEQFATQETLTETNKSLERHKGVSAVLDSPEPYAFRQITPFVLQNFGMIEPEDLDKNHKEEEEVSIPLWDISARFKKSADDTKKLADELAETPKQEQFAIAAKLAEYDPTYNAKDPQADAHPNIVSVDLLRELQFLNADYQSILKAISRTTTKGGDLAIIALVSKCSDKIPVIKARRDFIKFLIDNPDTLETLKENLAIIKEAEPLLFSNYRPFKQKRLRDIVKGGLVKAFIKKQFASHNNVEQFATQAELIYKPLASFIVSSIVSSLGAINLFKALRSNGDKLSEFGSYPQSAFNLVKHVWGLNIPHNLIKYQSEKMAWRSFLKHKIMPDQSFRAEIRRAEATYNQQNFFSRILQKNFWDTQKDAMFNHYFPTRSTPTSLNIFSRQDPAKDELRNILTAEIRAQQVAQKLELHDQSQRPNQPAVGPSTAMQTIGNAELLTKANVILEIEYTQKERNKIYNFIAIAVLIAGSAFILPTLEMSYRSYMANYLDLKNLFDSVQSPYKIYQAAKAMHLLLATIPETEHLYTKFIPSETKPWNHFLKLVTSRTFKNSFGPFDVEFVRKNHGEVVQAYECLNKSQAEIGELIRFYGELDAYVSMAQLVKEFSDAKNNQGTPVRYSVVEFIEKSQHPRFEADHYWNPMFTPERVIPNMINLGQNGLARNVIVTGANAGGKSGNLKAILTNIILAQTFGIAPAQNLKMTPFSNILATLKSNDDAANNKSRFQVEAFEMAKVMQKILQTPSNKFTAVFSDELFAGTEVEPAIALSRRICLSLAGMDNVMYMLATHYKELTKLEVLTRGVFKNFKVEVIKLPDGSLYRPYRLIEGIGGTNIAFDVFLEQLGDLGMRNDYLYNMVQQAKEDQQNFELINPVKTLGKEGFFSNRK